MFHREAMYGSGAAVLSMLGGVEMAAALAAPVIAAGSCAVESAFGGRGRKRARYSGCRRNKSG